MSREPARSKRGGGESLDLLSLARAGQAGTVADCSPGPRPRPSGGGGGGDARAGRNGAWDESLGNGVAWEGVAQRPVPASPDSPVGYWGGERGSGREIATPA